MHVHKLSNDLKVAAMLSSEETLAKGRVYVRKNSEACQADLEKDRQRNWEKRSAAKGAVSIVQIEEHHTARTHTHTGPTGKSMP